MCNKYLGQLEAKLRFDFVIITFVKLQTLSLPTNPKHQINVLLGGGGGGGGGGCHCEEVRRSNLLFFAGFPSLKLSKSLNNCNLPTYFNELRLEVTWQIASSYLLTKTRFS
jgi:hypothetical protein